MSAGRIPCYHLMVDVAKLYTYVGKFHAKSCEKYASFLKTYNCIFLKKFNITVRFWFIHRHPF